jgi:hypothetical protein
MSDALKNQSFAEWFAKITGGRVNDEATTALREIARKVIDAEGKGSIVITIGLEPIGNTKRQVQATTTVTRRPPKPGAEVTIHFVDEHGALQRDDPYQSRLQGAVDEAAADEGSSA